MGHTRRDFLRRGAGAAAAGVAVLVLGTGARAKFEPCEPPKPLGKQWPWFWRQIEAMQAKKSVLVKFRYKVKSKEGEWFYSPPGVTREFHEECLRVSFRSPTFELQEQLHIVECALVNEKDEVVGSMDLTSICYNISDTVTITKTFNFGDD